MTSKGDDEMTEATAKPRFIAELYHEVFDRPTRRQIRSNWEGSKRDGVIAWIAFIVFLVALVLAAEARAVTPNFLFQGPPGFKTDWTVRQNDRVNPDGYRSRIEELDITTRDDGVKIAAVYEVAEHPNGMPATIEFNGETRALTGIYAYERNDETLRWECRNADLEGGCWPVVTGDVERLHLDPAGVIEYSICTDRGLTGSCNEEAHKESGDLLPPYAPPLTDFYLRFPRGGWGFDYYTGEMQIGFNYGAEHVNAIDVRFYDEVGALLASRTVDGSVCEHGGICAFRPGFCPTVRARYTVSVQTAQGVITTDLDPEWEAIPNGCTP